MSDELKPKLDEFTSKVVSDPAKPPDTLLLQGFLGASSQPDHTRVYSDLTLVSYVDVPNADIIHVEQFPKDQSPMGGSYLWVKKETEALPASGTGELSAKAKFLQGPIAAEAAPVPQPVLNLPKTVPIIACHPSIVVRACTNTSLPRCLVQTPVCPTRPIVCEIVASGTGPCQIPDPTIQEGTFQFQPQQFQAQATGTAQVAPQFGTFPSVSCPTWFCPPPQTAFGRCVPHTPGCPQVHTLAAACGHTIAVSVCHVCPPQTIHGPECPIHTPLCPQQQASIACGEQTQPGQLGFAAHAVQALPATHAVGCPNVTEATCPTVLPQACPVTVATHPCPPPPTRLCPTPLHHCPSQLCPTPQHHCPSVSGFDCPSVNKFFCPSVNGFNCPSVNEFHCPSVNNFQCPPKTSHAADCPPTPQIQHCPTPNLICPRPSTLPCPSVTDVCPTSSPLFC